MQMRHPLRYFGTTRVMYRNSGCMTPNCTLQGTGKTIIIISIVGHPKILRSHFYVKMAFRAVDDVITVGKLILCLCSLLLIYFGQ